MRKQAGTEYDYDAEKSSDEILGAVRYDLPEFEELCSVAFFRVDEQQDFEVMPLENRQLTQIWSRFTVQTIFCGLVLGTVFNTSARAEETESIKPAANPMARTLVVFSAMGDVPYTPEEYILLPKQIADLPKESAFVVHLGDIKAGKDPCDEVIYKSISRILAQSQRPLFIIPGDNEWNDCAMPDEGWKLWLQYFSRFEERWKHDLTVLRQPKRDENFAFVRSEVLFVGVNLVGGRVHDAAEWKHRHAENLEWTCQNLERYGPDVKSAVIFGHAFPVNVHNDYFVGLSDAAKTFEKPIMYLHGDGHRWIHDRPFTAKNILRVQVDQGGIAPPVRVTVTDDAQSPFVFDRRQ